MGFGGDQQEVDDSGWHVALAALAWQVEAGLVDVIDEAPVDRYALAAVPPGQAEGRRAGARAAPAGPRTPAPEPAEAPPPPATDPVAVAEAAAAGAGTLDDLRAAMAAYPHCDLRTGARNLVFADGLPGARVLVLGEAPGIEEDRQGRPFIGEAGQLLDRMFAAIGLARSAPDPAAALYILNVLPWRTPANRDPDPAEIAMMMPFVRRHIALAAPEVIVVMGNVPLSALTGRSAILKARGIWTEALGLPVLPMVHPAYLLARNPLAKREAWADLLSLQARLGGVA